MPAWSWTDNTQGMLNHTQHLPEARQIYANYPANFKPDGATPSKAYKPRLNSDGMQGSKYWYSENPFYQAGFGLPNCTCYAWGRFWEICEYYGNKNKPRLSTGNAVDWWYYTQDGYQRSQKPELGAVAVWANAYNNGQPGHVAIVEKINSDGSIVTSNSNYGAEYFVTYNLNSSYDLVDGQGVRMKFLGFIINPCVKDTPIPPTPEKRKGMPIWMYLYPF